MEDEASVEQLACHRSDVVPVDVDRGRLERMRRSPEQGRVDGDVSVVADGLAFPNGMLVTPDNEMLNAGYGVFQIDVIGWCS